MTSTHSNSQASALVTGGISGLGLATAARLSKRGYHVIVVDLPNVECQARATQIGASYMAADVCDEAQVNAALQACVAKAPLRVVVNCAGIAPAAKVTGKKGVHALDLFDKTLRVNVSGSFNVMRLTTLIMQNQPAITPDGERGVIVFTASVAAYDGQIGQAAYSASKGAVVGMTLPIARELAAYGIRVMTIAPGIFETPMLLGMPLEVQQSLGAMIPFPQRLGKPDEYAQLVEHIIDNKVLNGEVIRLDGAVRMQPK